MNGMDHPCDSSVEFDRLLSRINGDLITCCMTKVIPESPVERYPFSFTEIKRLCDVDLRHQGQLMLFSRCMGMPEVEYITRGRRLRSPFFVNLEISYHRRELYITLSPQALYYCQVFSQALYNNM